MCWGQRELEFHRSELIRLRFLLPAILTIVGIMLTLLVGDSHAPQQQRTLQISRAAGLRFASVLADLCDQFPSAGSSNDDPIPLNNVDAEIARHLCDVCNEFEKAEAAGGADLANVALLEVKRIEQYATALDPTLAPMVTVARLANAANYLGIPLIINACVAAIVAHCTGKAPREFVAAFRLPGAPGEGDRSDDLRGNY